MPVPMPPAIRAWIGLPWAYHGSGRRSLAAGGTRARRSRSCWTGHWTTTCGRLRLRQALVDGPQLSQSVPDERVLATGTHILIWLKEFSPVGRVKNSCPTAPTKPRSPAAEGTFSVRRIESTISIVGRNLPGETTVAISARSCYYRPVSTGARTLAVLMYRCGTG